MSSTALSLLPAERRAVLALGTIYATRMLALFGVLPVMVLYASGLPGATPLGIGLALGAYGLTQALLQIPVGRWSDRIGRHPVIALGLGLFAIGSVVGALAPHSRYPLWWVIAGRAIQGAGAISGPTTALLADLTRTEVRTRAMAFIGISIGLCFIVSLLGAPVLAAHVGVPGLFWGMALLAVIGLLVLHFFVPRPVQTPRQAGVAEETGELLWPWHLSMFCLHAILTATFVGVPLALRDLLALPQASHWQVYLPVFLLSLLGTGGLVLWAERARHPDGVMRYGIALLVFAQGGMALFHGTVWALGAGLSLFFVAFNFLEARLPARLSQAAGPARRGQAMGVFATSQFLGAFAGGTLGGVLFGTRFGLSGLFAGVCLLALAWLLAFRPKKSA